MQVQTSGTAAQIFALDYLEQIKDVLISSFPNYLDLLAKLQAAIDVSTPIVDPTYSSVSTRDRKIGSL